mmetsp:Transcript_7411/g.18397  ORF Transcript_7411/g.18397 Transcript_7411/m.18397 type:complete len:202 (+) Transcript_7411:2-607(+)
MPSPSSPSSPSSLLPAAAPPRPTRVPAAAARASTRAIAALAAASSSSSESLPRFSSRLDCREATRLRKDSTPLLPSPSSTALRQMGHAPCSAPVAAALVRSVARRHVLHIGPWPHGPVATGWSTMSMQMGHCAASFRLASSSATRGIPSACSSSGRVREPSPSPSPSPSSATPLRASRASLSSSGWSHACRSLSSSTKMCM